MNKVVLVGRITKDPELKHTDSNIPFARFTIAVNRTYQNKDGERQADFIGCMVWRQQAENFARYMRKGSLIGIEGQIQTSSFDDQNGVRRFVTDVVCDRIHFLESKSSSRSEGYNEYQDYRPQERQHQGPKASEKDKNPFEDITSDFDISNDDLPF